MTPVPSPRSNRPYPQPNQAQRSNSKPTLNMTDHRHHDPVNPSQWLNFSLPPRQRGAGVPGSGVPGVPRRSRRGVGGALSRERYVHANFRFVLKPTEMLSYGAHFADADISIHWPHILQVLVPTFSAFSVAQGYVSESLAHEESDDLAGSLDEHDLQGMGEEAAERRRRVEEERRGRMCPICLGKPVAGRMTKCGHIFCFPCILHYIQLSDIPKASKCPICGDIVHEGMLKSVKYLDAATMVSASKGYDEDPEIAEPEHVGMVGEMEGFEEEAQVVDAVVEGDVPPRTGHLIHMRLIQRPQMTTLALPAAPTWPSEAVPPLTAPWYFLPDVLSYSRFMLATPDYMLEELDRELKELKAEWDLLRGDDLGRDFVRAAREKVERQVGKVRSELMTDMVKKSEKQGRDAWIDAVGGERLEREKQKERERRAKEREEKRKAEEESPPPFLPPQEHIPPNMPVEPNPMPTPRRSRKKNPQVSHVELQSPSYYFYQSSLGANVFLHPLDIRIILAHFKSYSLFPPTLSFHSTGFDPGTITDDLRKRCKYLSHLPTGTEVVFVEADLEDIVGKEGLAAFEQPLRARRDKRRARVKKEDRAKSKWEQSEREKLPPVTHTVAPYREDRDFAIALARSTLSSSFENGPAPGESLHPASYGSSSSHAMPSPGTSPSNPWSSRTFASTLTSAAHAPRPRTRETLENEWEVDAAWEAFDALTTSDTRDVEPGPDGEVRSATAKESEKGGGKKGKKQKKVLVLGGGGGRRA